jgi:DNA repair protein RecO (recombination protein O)
VLGVSSSAQALLLRRVEYGESDLVLTLFTDTLGRVSALARGARKSNKRFGGALEPMHTLQVRFDERPGAELVSLREASLQRPRLGVISDLKRLECAGRALAWVRKAAPPRTPEPEAWTALQAFLDGLDAPDGASSPAGMLAECGLRLLTAFGWGIDFSRCVRCGKSAPSGRGATVDPARGGLICQSCGGARRRLSSSQRDAFERATLGQPGALADADASLALELVEQALATHAGLE